MLAREDGRRDRRTRSVPAAAPRGWRSAPTAAWVADTARGVVVPRARATAAYYPSMRVGADVADVALAGARRLGARARRRASCARSSRAAAGPRPSRRPGPGRPRGGRAARRGRSAGDGTLTWIDAASAARRRPCRSAVVPVAVAVTGDTAWVADAAPRQRRCAWTCARERSAASASAPRPVAVAADGDERLRAVRGRPHGLACRRPRGTWSGSARGPRSGGSGARRRATSGCRCGRRRGDPL